MSREQEAAARVVAERKRVEAAAQLYRHQVAQETYAGGKRPEVAYSLVSIVDMLALDWRALDERMRSAVLDFVEQVEKHDERPAPRVRGAGR